jgi:hypothetical protein
MGGFSVQVSAFVFLLPDPPAAENLTAEYQQSHLTLTWFKAIAFRDCNHLGNPGNRSCR